MKPRLARQSTSCSYLAVSTLAGATLLLAACGGGMSGYTMPPSATSSSPPASAPPPPATSAPATQVTPTPPPGPVPTGAYPTTLYVGEEAVALLGAPGPAEFGDSCSYSASGVGSTTAPGFMQPAPSTGAAVVAPMAAGSATYSSSCIVNYPVETSPQTASATLTVLPAGPAAAQYLNSVLVSADAADGGYIVEPGLQNPWGITYVTQGPSPGWFTVAATGSQDLQIYTEVGLEAQPTTLPQNFSPTGVVQATAYVTINGKLCPSTTITASLGGQIAVWGNTECALPTTIVYSATNQAMYTALAPGLSVNNNPYLGVVDFHNGVIDVFDIFNGNFNKQTPSPATFSFADPALPANYAPYGIQNVPTGIIVTFVQRDPASPDTPAFGAGLGVVDLFDPSGNFIKRLISPGGALNAPLSVAVAPPDFGALSNKLLIGNVGDGRINAFDLDSGQFAAAVSDASGEAIVIPELHGLAFPQSNFATLGQSTLVRDDYLFYTAAGTDGTHGVVGYINLPRQ